MDFYTILDQVIALLRQRQRVTYRALQRQFGLDDTYLEDLKAELIDAQRLAVDEEGNVLVWTGDAGTAAPASALSSTTQDHNPQITQVDTELLPNCPRESFSVRVVAT